MKHEIYLNGNSPVFSFKKLKLLLALFCAAYFANGQAPIVWTSRGIGGGGALFAPSINPANNNEIYMGCDMTELFHTIDQGGHWTQLPFTQIQGGHDSQVQYTNDPNLLYSVDYSAISNVGMIRPLKSTDGGITWNVLSGNPYPDEPNGGILRLFADYNNPDHLVIADYGTIYFSPDGGNTFTQFHTCLDNGAGNHIAGVYFNGNNIYVGTNDGLLYYTNGGSTFSTMTVTGIPNTESMLSFSGATEGGTTRFVCLTSANGNVYAGIQYGSSYYGELSGIYTMDNSNGTWTSKLNGISIGSDFPVFVGMAQNDIDTIYAAGGSSAGDPIVMRSVDTGSWTHVFLTTNNQNIFTGWAGYQGDHGWSFPEAPFGFQVCPNNSQMVIFTTYSDAHVTTDGGNNWEQKYLSVTDENPENAPTPKLKKYHSIGLENTSCWDIMWTDSNTIFAGFSDIGGVTSADKGQSWSFTPNVMTQNTVYHTIKSLNGNIYTCTSDIHDMYQTTHIYDARIDVGTGAVWVSTNNGTSFTQIKSFSGPVLWIEIDPTDTGRMYAAVANSDTTKGGIWKSDNISLGASANWTRCSAPPRTEGHAYNIHVLGNGDLLASFSARKPTSSSSFTASSGVFYSNDHGASWLDRTDSRMLFYTTDVVADPNDTTNSTWYAGAFHPWGSGVSGASQGLYKTINKGINWQLVNANSHVNSCTINPTNPNELYVTTEADGLFISENINTANPTLTLVSSYPFAHPQRVYFNPYDSNEIWISSFGNGIKSGTIGSTLGISAQLQSSMDVKVFPNPAISGDFKVVVDPVLIGSKMEIYDDNGRIVFASQIRNVTSNVALNLAKGIYLLRINSGDEVLTRKIVL